MYYRQYTINNTKPAKQEFKRDILAFVPDARILTMVQGSQIHITVITNLHLTGYNKIAKLSELEAA